MSNSASVKILVVLSATLFCFCFLELTVRMLGRVDENGGCWFRQLRLKPYHVPEAAARRLITEYQTRSGSRLIHDSELGWAPRPLVGGMNGEAFLSTSPLSELARPSRRLRIALFGGSFTQCSFENGWWRVLESRLREAGIEADVVNYGVVGYGMDQAYLRWKKVRCRADIIVFGFVAGNAQDNVNLVRLLQNPSSELPFTKPRMVMDGAGLKTINVPTTPPEQIPGLMGRLDRWELIDREHYYKPGDYAAKWWRYSHFLAMIEAKVLALKSASEFKSFCDLKKEPAQLSLAIVQQFKKEAEASGSKFYAVHLPTEWDMRALRLTKHFGYEPLYSVLKESMEVIQPEEKLRVAIEAGGIANYFYDGHFTAAGNEIVGKSISDFLIERQGKR